MTWLVADVGGTNARFALITAPGAAPERIGTLRTRDHPGLAEAAAAYLERYAPDVQPDAACLAVAGPVANGRFRLTNAGWPPGTVDQVRAHLGLPYVEILNDFEGLALALPHLTEDDAVRIGPTPPSPSAPQATSPLATAPETPNTPASGQRTPGTPASASFGTGTRAPETGTLATGASGTPASGTPASASFGTGTGTGAWASDTRGPHTPTPDTSASGTSASGTSASDMSASGASAFGGRVPGTLAVLGPGTGLGVGGLLPVPGAGPGGGVRWMPIASEGGQVDIPAATEREIDVMRLLRAERGAATAEYLLWATDSSACTATCP